MMNLLKELHQIVENSTYTAKNIIIEDHSFDPVDISFTGVGEAKLSNFVIEGWFDIVKTGDAPYFKATLSIDFDYEKSDVKSHIFGSEVKLDTKNSINPYNIIINKILYVDSIGHRSDHIPSEVLKAFGSESAVNTTLTARFSNYIKAVNQEILKHVF